VHLSEMFLGVSNKLILVDPHDDLSARAVEMCFHHFASNAMAAVDLKWNSVDPETRLA
jgi:hypothetical protein